MGEAMWKLINYMVNNSLILKNKFKTVNLKKEKPLQYIK